MIVEFMLNIIWALVKPLLDLLPTVSLNISVDTLDVFIDAVQAACYLLPMTDIIIMIGIVVAITVFRIIVSLLKTIWDILPLV